MANGLQYGLALVIAASMLYSDKQAPRLWMDTAWHMLMDDYLTLSHQRFHCKDVEDVTEGLEESLLKKFASQVWVSHAGTGWHLCLQHC